MRAIVYFISCSIFLISCNAFNISNSKWEYKINEESISYIEFKNDSLYTEYDSEIGEHLYGTYSQNENQITLNQTSGEFDSEFPKGSKHRTKEVIYIMIIKNKNQLGYIDNWKSNKWEDAYFFQKVDK